MLFANVTSLSKVIMDYIQQSSVDRYQCFGLAEHKKPREDIETAQKAFVGAGLKSYWTQARRTEKGVSGGTSVHIKRHFKANRLDWASLPDGQVLPVDPAMWTGVIIHAAINIVIVVAYFKDGVGMNEENVSMLTDILGWVKAAGLPWIIVADWNMTPQDLIGSGMLGSLAAEIVTPADCEATCSAGTGRLLDFAVVSEVLAGSVMLGVDLVIPTKPHVGLSLAVRLEAMQERILVLQAPPIPRLAHVNKKDHRAVIGLAEDPELTLRKRRLPRKGKWVAQDRLHQALCDKGEDSELEQLPDLQVAVTDATVTFDVGDERPRGLSWKEAKSIAEEWKLNKGTNSIAASRSPIIDSVAFQLDPESALALGDAYSSTITSAEFYAASRDEAFAEDLERAVGRAKGPRYRLRALKDHIGCDGPVELSGSSQEARAWAVISGKLSLYAKLMAKDSEQAGVQAMKALWTVRGAARTIAQLANNDNELSMLRVSAQLDKFLEEIDLASHDELVRWSKKAAGLQRAKTCKVAQQAKRSFVQWQLRDQGTGGTGVFAWIRRAEASPEQVDPVVFGRLCVDNRHACMAKARRWNGLWSAVGTELETYFAELDEVWRLLIMAIQGEELPKVTLQAFHEALYTFANGTGLGSDRTSPAMIKALPLEAKEELVALFNAIQDCAAWPWQWLHVVVALIPKPQGGERPIGLLPFLMRVFFRVHRDGTRRWVDATAGSWDTAIRNSSALRAALLRALDIESAMSEEQAFALILLDIEKFYDSVPLALLVKAGLQLGYSPTLLALCLSICLAQRSLKTIHGASEELQPLKSIVAGLGEANNLAKIVVHGICEQYTAEHANVKLKTFVDDMAQITRGKSEVVAVDAARASRALAQGLMTAGFVVSTKSQLLTNCERTKHVVRSALQGINVDIKVVDQAVDLGADISNDGMQSQLKRSVRIKAAEAKAARIRRLHGAARRVHLTRAVVVAQQTYATEITALKPAQVAQLRRTVCGMLGYKRGMCTYSLLQLHGQANPAVDIRWMQVKAWIQLWHDHPERHRQLRLTWRKHLARMRTGDNTHNFRRAAGPVNSMLAMLLEQGITPTQPDLWDTGRGTTWAMSRDPIDMEMFRKEFAQLVEESYEEKAARHHLGSGLDKGGNFQAAAKLRARAVAAGQPMTAGLIDSVVTAAMWTNTRCHEAGYNIATACQLCGAPEDTDAHRLWYCTAVCNSTIKDIKASNHLCVEARAMTADDPRPACERVQCLWLRGIVPAPWLETKVPETTKTASMGILEEQDWNLHRRTIYLDESAGRYSANPCLRRCGWGVFVMDDDRQPIGAFSSTLAGSQQSQIRACLEGILHIARHSSGDVLVKPDCNAAVDGLKTVVAKGAPQFAKHADLWHQIKLALDDRIGTLSISRVDAHADVRGYIEQGLSIADWIGNELSDYLAGEAAEANKVTDAEEATWHCLQNRATMILKRAVAVHRLFMGDDGSNTVRGQWIRPKHPVHCAIIASGHDLVKDARGAFQCLSCGQRSGARQFKEWLAGPKCVALSRRNGELFDRHEEVQDLEDPDSGAVRIGSKLTHTTHTLSWKRGIWFCTTCGGFSKAAIGEKSTCRKLSRPCKEPTRSGREVLSRIEAGLTPRAGTSWPMAEAHHRGLTAMKLEELWPDKRGASRPGKRQAPDEAEDLDNKAPKIDGDPDCGELEDPSTVQHIDDGDDGDQEPVCKVPRHECDTELGFINEDEDPWGHGHDFDLEL